jgi:hypothetical protein
MSLSSYLPLLFALIVISAPTFYFSWLAFLALQSRNWPKANATVTRCELRQTPGFRRQASLDFAYQYTIDGKKFTGTRVKFGDFLGAHVREAITTAQRYQQGKKVTIYYHPKNPQLSVIETRPAGYLLLWILIGVLALGSILFGISRPA